MLLIKSINLRYIFFSLLLYLILLFSFSSAHWDVSFINILTSILYFIVIQSQLSRGDSFYTTERFSRIILIYSGFFILIFNLISYGYNQNYFVFSELDAEIYHLESLEMTTGSFIQGMNNFLRDWSLEDFGAVLVISTLYRIVESNLIVNFLYLILSIFSGIGMFKIGIYMMSRKYAYFGALAFTLSSFFIWFNSSGLKESLIIFLVIFCFLNYYKFRYKGKLSSLSYVIFFLLALMLFRPAITFLILGSLLMAHFAGRKKKGSSFLFIAISVGGIIYGAPFLSNIIDRFLLGGVSQMIEVKEASGMVTGGVGFTYMVNIVAGLVGPLPTIIPDDKILLSFFAPGLIYKSLISIPFLYGIYYIYKRRLSRYYPLALFAIFEIASLVFIMEGLELRKSLPHFPMIYIVAFGFLSIVDGNEGFLISNKIKKSIKNRMNILFFLIFLLIIFWNVR